MRKVETATKRCTKCGRLIEVCTGCAEPDCLHPICGDCLRIQVGEEMRQPHTHGG